MTNEEMAVELDELMTRFKRLKKALDEEQLNKLSPAEQAIAEAARQFKGNLTKANKAAFLRKAQEIGEQQQAQRLANQLQKAGILGTRPPPRQPTSEEMSMAAQNMYAQSNGFSTQEEMNKAEQNWGNGINNWLVEASKPISQKFKNEQEEREYWDKIKINDSGRGDTGY